MSRASKIAMKKARNFPTNTCPASRHAQLLAETLMSNRPTWYVTDDRQHSGESIAATVTALWHARSEIERLRELLAKVADEPNIDRARALADAELHGKPKPPPRITTAAELRQQAKSDTSCVGAFARARPGA